MALDRTAKTYAADVESTVYNLNAVKWLIARPAKEAVVESEKLP